MIEACERLPGGGSCVASGAVHPLSQVKPVTGIAQLTGVCASPTCGFVFDVKRQNAAVDGGSGKWKLVKAVLHDHACGRLRTTSIAADANAPAASAKSRKDNARCVYGAGVLVRVVVEANSSSKTSFKPESVKLLITASSDRVASVRTTMDAAPAAAARKPCCVCDEPGGKHCNNCKSRHYCSKACQLVDWNEGGHKAQCKKLATEFSNRLLDELMPAKKVKEEPAIVEDVLLADGSKAAARLSAARTTVLAKTSALNDVKPNWRGTCAICLDQLPLEFDKQTFYECCCKTMCTICFEKCRQHDKRCPLCRAPPRESDAEWLRRLQKHVDKGNAQAQIALGDEYSHGGMGLQQNFKRAVQLYELAVAQGHAYALTHLGVCYERGLCVGIDHKTAAQLYQRAADQGLPLAQNYLGDVFYKGRGVAQSYDEAVKWYRLAAAQGHPRALYNLSRCYARGMGVSRDVDEALRLYKLAASKGLDLAATANVKPQARLAGR
ncbi:hypothetical protein M885DRAFT_615476 [Pelagophyceae sp. CCMP2097]|nr:hypothetical protein M885DRAFT_615476 [Pelagophyceae sp. CCMP2097]